MESIHHFAHWHVHSLVAIHAREGGVILQALEGQRTQNCRSCSSLMRLLLAALLSLTAFVIVMATEVKGSVHYTTHIGSRVPPAEAGCFKTGDVRNDEGKLLNVFKCPV